MTDIENAGSGITYAHLLVVFEKGRDAPIAIISSEAAATDDEFMKKLGIDPADVPPTEGSHFLCAFVEDGHQNFGYSNDWADLDKFERAALDLVAKLKLAPAKTQSSPAISSSSPRSSDKPKLVLAKLFGGGKDAKK